MNKLKLIIVLILLILANLCTKAAFADILPPYMSYPVEYINPKGEIVKPSVEQIIAFKEADKVNADSIDSSKDGLKVIYGDKKWHDDYNIWVYKYGIATTDGKIIIKPQFQLIHNFSEGLAPVSINNKWGYIDKTGKMVIKPQFVGVGDFYCNSFHTSLYGRCKDPGLFHEGFAVVHSKFIKVGFIDKTGKFLSPPNFYDALAFSEGLAAVKGSKQENYKWGYIDKTGKMVISQQFLYASRFHNGIAEVRRTTMARKARLLLILFLSFIVGISLWRFIVENKKRGKSK